MDMKRRLPPLDLLIPFEAAARLDSFTRAAEELSVTQSAVSQRVRKLEDQLGIALFDRANRRIVLTAEGRELLNGVTVALQHLGAATDSVRRVETFPRIRLAADTSITGMWLMPKLRDFAAAHPAVDIDLTASDDEATCLSAEIAVLHGAGDWPGFESVKLFDDEIFPVCAPDYEPRPEAPPDLLHAQLLDLDYQRWNWMNWGIWLTEQGIDPEGARRTIQSNSYGALIDAARMGIGVALGWRDFVADDLERGTLVRPMTESVSTRFGYYLAMRHEANESARMLRGWLARRD